MPIRLARSLQGASAACQQKVKWLGHFGIKEAGQPVTGAQASRLQMPRSRCRDQCKRGRLRSSLRLF